MSVAPFPREAEEARALLRQAEGLLVDAAIAVCGSEKEDAYHELANLVSLSQFACSEPRTEALKAACEPLQAAYPLDAC